MEENRAGFKGYVIDARPFQLADDGSWSSDFNIERHDGDDVNERHYSGALTFETKEEAVKHCLRLGAQIIDGVYPHCSAP
jgi:hypothetical protein